MKKVIDHLGNLYSSEQDMCEKYNIQNPYFIFATINTIGHWKKLLQLRFGDTTQSK